MASASERSFTRRDTVTFLACLGLSLVALFSPEKWGHDVSDALRETEGDFVAQLNADRSLHERMCALSGNGTLTHTWLGVSGLARAAVTAAGPRILTPWHESKARVAAA